MTKGQRVLVDTVAIIEAYRLGCWQGLVQFYSIETVDTCVIECATGDKRRKGYVSIDQQELIHGIKVHAVTGDMRVKLVTADSLAATLDPGEKDLLAFALTLPDVVLLCSPDKAAICSAHRLNLLERLVALQQMVVEAGMKRRGYKLQHTAAWLASYKTQVLLGMV